jgi:membrane-associated phospholipid phosphatase
MARVVLRAHWPSDVLAGIALGLALAAAAGLLALRRPAHAAPPVRARG